MPPAENHGQLLVVVPLPWLLQLFWHTPCPGAFPGHCISPDAIAEALLGLQVLELRRRVQGTPYASHLEVHADYIVAQLRSALVRQYGGALCVAHPLWKSCMTVIVEICSLWSAMTRRIGCSLAGAA